MTARRAGFTFRVCLHSTVVSHVLSSMEEADCSALGIPFAGHGWTCKVGGVFLCGVA